MAYFVQEENPAQIAVKPFQWKFEAMKAKSASMEQFKTNSTIVRFTNYKSQF